MADAGAAPSLRNRLLALVLGGVAIAWIGAAVWAYRDARHETNELLDGYLVQAAALLVAQAGDDLGELDIEHAPQLHRYARRVAFQIWERGETLRVHSANAPDRRLSRRTDGFDDVEIDGERWRVFSSYDTHRRILVHEAVERLVSQARSLVGLAGVEHPAHQQERVARGVADLDLARERRHRRVDHEARRGAGLLQHVGQGARQELARPQLDRVRGPAGQRGQERGQALGEGGGRAALGASQRRELEQHDAELVTEPLAGRVNHRGLGDGAREKVRVPREPAVPRGLLDGARPHQVLPRLDHEAEVVRHLVREVREVGGGERGVEGAVDADGAQQRVGRVGGEPVACQRRLVDVAGGVVDQPRPTGERPRRRAEPHPRAERGRERDRFPADRRRTGNRVAKQVELRVRRVRGHGVPPRVEPV